ncbi:MAG TPA: PRC-barrel domain-containing protein [Acetobacteraceae bacterium]|nr:PRC-barrel domain-containing protein [Acetobacteraceae bacterium]
MLDNKILLQLTTAIAVCAAPLLAHGQANTGGSSQQQSTTSTTPQQGAVSGYPAARDAATVGREMGSGQSTAGSAAPSATGGSGGQGMRGQGTTNNQSGAAGGTPTMSSGGTAAAPGVPGGQSSGNVGGSSTPQPEPGQPGRRQGSDATPLGRGPTLAQAETGSQARTGAQGRGDNPAAQSGAAATTGASAGAGMAADNAMARNARRASRVIGSAVYNENNESIGEVEDILIPQGGGQPMAVLSVGGFLGIGARLVAVPYDRLQRNNDRDRWMLQGATREGVRSMPEFRYEGG